MTTTEINTLIVYLKIALQDATTATERRAIVAEIGTLQAALAQAKAEGR